MIQRIQTLFLLLTIIASSLFLTGGYVNIINSTSGYEAVARFSGVYTVSSGSGNAMASHLFPVPVISVLVPFAAVVAIFLYKNRKLQKKIIFFDIMLELILIISVFILLLPVVQHNSAILKPGYRIIMPLLSLIFLVVAYLGVRKDDELVKSYDRLR
jgi:hypothetical protein